DSTVKLAAVDFAAAGAGVEESACGFVNDAAESFGRYVFCLFDEAAPNWGLNDTTAGAVRGVVAKNEYRTRGVVGGRREDSFLQRLFTVFAWGRCGRRWRWC